MKFYFKVKKPFSNPLPSLQSKHYGRTSDTERRGLVRINEEDR